MNYNGIKSYIEILSKDMNIPGYSIGIISKGEITKYIGGLSDLNKFTAINNDTLFPISCCTKMFTALAVLMLKYNLDIPINQIDNRYKFKDEYVNNNITLRDLLSHKSGLHPNTLWSFISRDQEPEIIINELSKLSFSPFREKYIYSNLTYSIIGEIINKSFNKSYVNIIEDLIFNTFDMKSSKFFNFSLESDSYNIAKPYIKNKNILYEKRFLQMQLYNPASGIITNIDDSLKFLSLLINNYKKKHFYGLFEPNILTENRKLYKELGYQMYSLGLYTQSYRDYDIYYHNGFIVGYSSLMAVIPELELGITIFTNMDKSVFPRIVMMYILDNIFNDNNINWKRRLLREELYGNLAKENFEKAIDNEKLSELSKFKANYKVISFNKYGLKVIIMRNQKNIISINNNIFNLEQISENKFFCYIEEINDYLIISINDNGIVLNGTNIIDELRILNDDIIYY